MASKVIFGLLLICLIASVQAATTYQLVYTITKEYVDNEDNTVVESTLLTPKTTM